MPSTQAAPNPSFPAGIFAAGHGTRLQSAFPETTKPLLPLQGVPLIHWTISSLVSGGMREATILLNSRGRKAKDYIQAQRFQIPLRFLEADTPSSWESFRLLAKSMAERHPFFLLSTVDALIDPSEISRFARASMEALSDSSPAAALALTRFVEDEKPLWADLDATGRISTLGSSCQKKEFVTCGLYAVNGPLSLSLEGLPSFESLRKFWDWALRSSIPLRGIPLSKTIDVDRPEDIREAEKFVAGLGIQ